MIATVTLDSGVQVGALILLAQLVLVRAPRVELEIFRNNQLLEAVMKQLDLKIPPPVPKPGKSLPFLAVLLIASSFALMGCEGLTAVNTGGKRALCHFGDTVCKGTRIICGEPDPTIVDAHEMPAPSPSTLARFQGPRVLVTVGPPPVVVERRSTVVLERQAAVEDPCDPEPAARAAPAPKCDPRPATQKAPAPKDPCPGGGCLTPPPQ